MEIRAAWVRPWWRLDSDEEDPSRGCAAESGCDGGACADSAATHCTYTCAAVVRAYVQDDCALAFGSIGPIRDLDVGPRVALGLGHPVVRNNRMRGLARPDQLC